MLHICRTDIVRQKRSSELSNQPAQRRKKKKTYKLYECSNKKYARKIKAGKTTNSKYKVSHERAPASRCKSSREFVVLLLAKFLSSATHSTSRQCARRTWSWFILILFQCKAIESPVEYTTQICLCDAHFLWWAASKMLTSYNRY